MRPHDDTWPDALPRQRLSWQTLATAAPCTAMDTAERMRVVCPDSEEVRMARAIASSVVAEALVRGESHVSFRGFRIGATRLPFGHVDDFVIRVELVVRLDGHIIDREIAEILPLHFARCETCQYQ